MKRFTKGVMSSYDKYEQEVKQLRRDRYMTEQKEALLTVEYPESLYSVHLNVFSDGRERGLWLAMQDIRDIDKNPEVTMFPGKTMLVEWDSLEKLHKTLGKYLEANKKAGK